MPGEKMYNTPVPNFFIVGAAKSGTTSLSFYLEQHPEVFISPLKEPYFFSSQFKDKDLPPGGIGDDWPRNFVINNLDEYLSLFRHAKNEKAIGEATAGYLYYYKRAIPKMKQLFGDVKILIILRNPVSRAFSAYKHLVRDMRETKSFEDALELEEYRKQNNWEYLWHLTSLGYYHDQVKAYLENFSQVKVLFFEDIIKNPQELMKEVFRFLDVDPNFKIDTEGTFNPSGIPRSKIMRWLTRPSGLKALVYKGLTLLGIKDSDLSKGIEVLRGSEREQLKMSDLTKKKLQKLYRPEIEKLENLLDKDLKHWLT